MATTHRVCPSCHLFGGDCQGRTLGEGETCPRYENRLHWLVRQFDQVQHAQSRARALAAVGAASLLVSIAAWMVLADRDGMHLTAAQAHASATKALTASASGANTATR